MKFSTKLFPIVLLISAPAAHLFSMEDPTATTMLETSIQKPEKQALFVQRLIAERAARDASRKYWELIAEEFAALLNKETSIEKEISMNQDAAKTLVKEAAHIKKSANELIKAYDIQSLQPKKA